MRIKNRARSLIVSLALAGLVGSLIVVDAARPLAAEEPLKLKWAELVPPAPPAPRKLQPFFARRSSGMVDLAEAAPPNAHQGAPPPPRGGGRWMSNKSRGLSKPPAVVESLNGKRVEIGGYVVPLTFEATTVKEFLLVPFVGACLHVPPPPANQIIYVKLTKGFEVNGAFEPVYVTGKLKTETSFTGLADTGYSLDADIVEKRAN